MTEQILDRIQNEQAAWSRHNFGDRPSWQPLLGLQEEIGELAHHYLKREQGIRLEEDHDAEIKDAAADIVIYLLDFCNAEGIQLSKELDATWEQVKKRDWKANPKTGEVDDS